MAESMRQGIRQLYTTWADLNRDLKLLWLAWFLWAAGYSLYGKLWPIYVTSLGASPQQLGTVFAIGFAVAVLVYLPGGLLVDRAERKSLLVLSWLLAVPAPLIFALAEQWQTVIAGVVLYFASVISMPAFNAYVADASPGRISAAFTVIFASGSLATIAAPAAGGFMAERFGMRPVFFLAFLFYLASVGSLLLSPQRPRRTSGPAPGGSYMRLMLEPRRAGWLLFCALIYLALYLPVPYMSPFLREHGLSFLWIGLLGSVAALGDVLLAPVLGRWSDRWNRHRTLALALTASVTPFLAMAVAPRSIPLLLLVFFLYGTFHTSQSLMTSTAATLVPPEARGRVFGLFGTLTGLGMTAAPLLGGWLYGWDARLPFQAAVGMGGLAAVGLLVVGSRRAAGSGDRRAAGAGD